MIYLDNAASAPLLPEVINTMLETMQRFFGNPSSIHHFGREARVLIEDARKEIALSLNVSPSEIVFTSGGTEANNWAIASCVRAYNIQHIITSKAEHPAVLKPIENLSLLHNIDVSFLPHSQNGSINLTELEELLKTNTDVLVCLMQANNETGTLLPLKSVSELCQKYHAFFMTDMVQTIGKYPIDLKTTKVNFATASAHKFHGPKGVGFLYINNDNPIAPIFRGGGQERNRRAGTENTYGIAGMAKALSMSYENMQQNTGYILSLKNYMVSRLSEIKGISYNADSDKSGLYTILNVAFPKTAHSEMLVYNFDIAGIAVSGGSACSSGSINPSHVLETLGYANEKTAVRFSFSKLNSTKEIDTVIDFLKHFYNEKK